jgi:hypothetical protein
MGRAVVCSGVLALALAGCGEAPLVEDSGAVGLRSAKVVGPRGTDAGGDGRADVVLRQDGGRLLLWTMNGAAIASQAELGGVGPEWTLVDASGDFDGDGRTDLLWRSTSGAVAIWLMNGATRLSATVVDTLDPAWSLVDGRGDYDGDGRSDLLFRHANGTVAIWRMTGATRAAAFFPATVPTEWTIADGSGDYDGDGRSDVLWRRSDGATAVWRMVGGMVASTAFLPGVGPEWTLVDGSGDYDGDGRSDLLWRSRNEPVVAWYMGGTGTVAATAVLGLAGPEWRVLDASSDFDGDRRSDVLWQQSDGLLLLWTVSGTARTGAVSVGRLGSDWRVSVGSGVKDGTIPPVSPPPTPPPPSPPPPAPPPADTTPPTVSITDDVSGVLFFGQRATFTFTWSEPVSGFTASDVQVTGGVRDDATFVAVSASQYRVQVVPNARSTQPVVVTVLAGAAADAASNPNPSADAVQTVDTNTAALFFDSASPGTGGAADGSAGDAGTPGSPPRAVVLSATVNGAGALDLAWDRCRPSVPAQDPCASGVTEAQYYQILVRQGIGESLYPMQGGRITTVVPRYAVTVPNTPRTSYRVRACSGPPGLGGAQDNGFWACTDSNEVGPGAAVTYVKASDAAAGHGFGTSVSLANDGNLLAVSAPQRDGNAGSVYLYRRTGEVWAQEAVLRPASVLANDQFGERVMLSADGTTLAVTAPEYPRSGATGTVYLFVRSGGSWVQQAAVRPTSGLATTERFAQSLALSGDGSTLVSGGYDRTGFRGFAYVFTRSGSTWTQSQRIVPADPEANDFFGTEAALSQDGTTLALGAPWKFNFQGAAYVFARTGATFSQQTRLLASDGVSNDFFGRSLSLSSNGARLAVGADQASSARGAVYLYGRSGTAWSQLVRLQPQALRTDTWFGAKVALSGDGRKLAASGWSDDADERGLQYAPTRDDYFNPYADDLSNGDRIESGAAWIFIEVNGAWRESAIVKAPNADAEDRWGVGLALSGGGRTLAIGGPGEDGAARTINGDRSSNAAGNAGAVFVH